MKSFVPLLESDTLFGSASVSVAEGVKPQTFDSKGVSIQYRTEGAGQPVALIHGLFASAQINWGAPGIIRSLAKDYQVIAMDARGHGGSGKPDQEEAYGVEMVEDVARLLDHLKIRKAHVIGYSMGGMIALKLMTLHPERVQSALLGGMGWLRDRSPLHDLWSRVPQRRRDSAPLSACIQSLGALAVTEAEIRAIRMPVAVVVGELDPVRGVYVAPLEKVRPGWPVTLIAGAGHIDCIFRPEFREALKAWLDKQSGQVPAAHSR